MRLPAGWKSQESEVTALRPCQNCINSAAMPLTCRPCFTFPPCLPRLLANRLPLTSRLFFSAISISFYGVPVSVDPRRRTLNGGGWEVRGKGMTRSKEAAAGWEAKDLNHSWICPIYIKFLPSKLTAKPWDGRCLLRLSHLRHNFELHPSVPNGYLILHPHHQLPPKA